MEKMEKRRLPPNMIYRREKVISSKMLANIYDCEPQRITENFKRNTDRFKKDVHFFSLENREKEKVVCSNENGVGVMDGGSLIFWTEKGVLLHAEILNSDRAWESYEHLIDNHFWS